MKISISGILDGAGCSCSGLNSTYKVPKTGGTTNYCEGSISAGINCGGLPVPGVLEWTMTCNPDGTKSITVDLLVGSLTKDSLSLSASSSADCCGINVSGVSSTGDNNCLMGGGTFDYVIPYGGECPEDPVP